MTPDHALQQVAERIRRACERAGRDPGQVILVGASKRVPAERLEQFQRAGLREFGENYVQEGREKIRHFRERGLPARWHLIGALQSNKARDAVREFDLIHSVDRLSLAQAIQREAAKMGKVQAVLLQVNLEGESTKAGAAPEALPDLLDACIQMEQLQVRGLMSLPPFLEDPEAMRPYHRRLRELRDQLWSRRGVDTAVFNLLSMGMTNDFEAAVEEGATHVRVGTGLFGQRM